MHIFTDSIYLLYTYVYRFSTVQNHILFQNSFAGFNGVIKRVVTFRDKLDVADFIYLFIYLLTAPLRTDHMCSYFFLLYLI